MGYHYNYYSGSYPDTFHLYIKDLITDKLTFVDTGNGNTPLVNNTSANLIPDDTALAANAPDTSSRWFIYDLVNEGHIRAMYEVEEYYGTKIIATLPALAIQLHIKMQPYFQGGHAQSVIGYYDMRLTYQENRRLVKIGNLANTTGMFSSKFMGLTPSEAVI